MNTKLTQAYVAKKVAKYDQKFAFAQETMSREDYLKFVMNQKASAFDNAFLDAVKAVIFNRFKIRPHSMLFKNPTLSQWVVDVLGAYEYTDILKFISEKSGASVKKLQNSTVGGSLLDMNFLITLVEELECATGKILCNEQDVLRPLEYLDDDITYVELAKFFTSTGSSRVESNKREAGMN